MRSEFQMKDGNPNPSPESLEKQYNVSYKEALESESTVECTDCGYTLLGEDPKRYVLCFRCYCDEKLSNRPH